MSWRRLVSRCGVPTAPRKYFVVTMFVALMLHSAGNSTPRCSKLNDPSRQLVMTTSRRSQVTSSYGCTPAVVKTRLTFRPFPLVGALAARRVRPDKRSPVSVTELSLWCGPCLEGIAAAGEEPHSVLAGGADGSGDSGRRHRPGLPSEAAWPRPPPRRRAGGSCLPGRGGGAR